MNRFTELYRELDASNRATTKVAALKRYFSDVPACDGAWAVFFLTGQRLKRTIRSKDFREWAGQACGYPHWMVEECYERVGDLAETLALLLASKPKEDSAPFEMPLHQLVEEKIVPLRGLEPDSQRQVLFDLWDSLDATSCFVFNKLITGGFRVGVSKTLVNRALAEIAQVDPAVMAHRLMGNWKPSESQFKSLFDPERGEDDKARPFPFCLAYALEDGVKDDLETRLGPVDDWQIEWKWDGIRAQLIKRGGGAILWSRGEEMVSEQFPEIIEAAGRWDGEVVLDGELLVWDHENDQVAPFAALQKRLGRKKVGPKLRKDSPVVFMAYDLLESNGVDRRENPTMERRRLLEDYLSQNVDLHLKLSHVVQAADWNAVCTARISSRERRVEGLMLKKAQSPYFAGRKKGEWWKWKVDPYRVDAVMVYAQQGHGRRAGLYTDYTFSVWDGETLVPFAKAYSGLTDAEIRKADRWIRQHTLEKQGPVRVVEPRLVFEIAFEGISESKRHKSGIAVRFPRMHRWREDKLASEADTLETVRALLS